MAAIFNFFIMADVDILFFGKLETWTMWGSVIFPYDWYLWSGSHFLIFFIMADADIMFPSTLGKPKQWVGNLKFVHMIDIYKMAAIFQFVHNDQHWYSISVVQFSIGSVFWIFHWFSFPCHPMLCLKHLCMDIYAWWLSALVENAKKSAKIGSHIYSMPW